MLAHLRRTKGGTHSVVCLISHLTVTNQCPICRSVLASRYAAQHHVAMAIISKKCRLDLGLKALDPFDPKCNEIYLPDHVP